MITADKNTALGRICGIVDALEVGQRVDIDVFEMRDIGSYEHNGAVFLPPDRVMENIVGSSFNLSYTAHPDGQAVTFQKHKNTDKRHYKSPDRRLT